MAYSSVTLFRENANKEKFVIIYYKHGDKTVRHRTSITVKTQNFDKKSGKVKSSDAEAKSKNEIIDLQSKHVESLIEEFVKEHGIKPSSEFINKQLASGVKIKQAVLETNLLDCYESFLLEKKIEFNSPERSSISIKDYNSLKNALKDYEKLNGEIFPLDINDEVWLNKFNTFLSNKRPKIKDYKFISGKQNDKTRRKRFGSLKTFAIWLVSNGYLKNCNQISAYKVKVQKKNYYTLELDEIKLLQEKVFKSSTHQKAIDMFLVACHTGLRYSDVVRIGKSYINEKNGVFILALNNQKTREKIEVPLSNKVLEILTKYDCNLCLMTDQSVNKYLHEALKEFEEFHEEVEFGTQGDSKPVYELITFHTGRRTFITNLVNNNVNLNAIMKMTGHKKLSTLQGYINPNYNLMLDNIKIFNNI